VALYALGNMPSNLTSSTRYSDPAKFTNELMVMVRSGSNSLAFIYGIGAVRTQASRGDAEYTYSGRCYVTVCHQTSPGLLNPVMQGVADE
jgi:hypothetical protein